MHLAYRNKDGSIFVFLKRYEIEHACTYIQAAIEWETRKGNPVPPREDIVGVDEKSGFPCLKFSFLHREFAASFFRLIIWAYQKEGRTDEADRLHNALASVHFFQDEWRLS